MQQRFTLKLYISIQPRKFGPFGDELNTALKVSGDSSQSFLGHR
jgi:hypothetical protein